MNAPEHLAWLALLPLLWWLQRPPRPRRALLTAHFTQWQRARERLRRRPIRFDVMRFLLLVVAFAAAIVAATGATLPGRPGATSLVVLLDDSASLTADDGAPWRDAVARVRDTLQSLPPHITAALVRTGDDGLTVHAGTADELLAAVPAAPDGRRTLDLEAVAARLAGDVSADSRIAVWTITDGLGDAIPPRIGALSIVGAERHNVGIVGIAIADGWPLRDVAIDVRVANHGPARSVRITATGGVVATPPRDLALSANGDASLRLELQRTDGGTVTVALTDAADAFPRDDTVRIELPPRTETNVGLLADVDAGPWARAAAETLADELNGRVVAAAERAGFLVVDGGVFVPPADAVPRLTFGTRDRQAPLTAADLVDEPAVVDWDRDHPITRGLDLSELRIARALRGAFGGAGQPLIWSEHGPLAVVTADERPSVHVAFRLADTNLPVLAAFPQFLRRSFAATAGARGKPVVWRDALLSPHESALRAAGERTERPLPAFATPGLSLTVPLLLLALLALAVRVHA